MQQLRAHLLEILYRLRLYLLGVRFHEWRQSGELTCVLERHCLLDNCIEVRFEVYLQPCHDFILRKGKLDGNTYKSYIVKAYFKQPILEQLLKLNERSFYFNGYLNRFTRDETMTIALVLDIYLDFVSSVIKKNPTELKIV